MAVPSALNSDGTGPCVGVNCNDSEIGFLFVVEWQGRTDTSGVVFLNFDASRIYWASTEASETDAYAWDVLWFRQGPLQKDLYASVDLGKPILTGPVLAWPVHDGDVSTIILKRLFKDVLQLRNLRAHSEP